MNRPTAKSQHVADRKSLRTKSPRKCRVCRTQLCVSRTKRFICRAFEARLQRECQKQMLDLFVDDEGRIYRLTRYFSGQCGGMSAFKSSLESNEERNDSLRFVTWARCLQMSAQSSLQGVFLEVIMQSRGIWTSCCLTELSFSACLGKDLTMYHPVVHDFLFSVTISWH